MSICFHPPFQMTMARSMASVAGGATKRTKIVTSEVTKSLQILSDQKINVEHDAKTLK